MALTLLNLRGRAASAESGEPPPTAKAGATTLTHFFNIIHLLYQMCAESDYKNHKYERVSVSVSESKCQFCRSRRTTDTR